MDKGSYTTRSELSGESELYVFVQGGGAAAFAGAGALHVPGSGGQGDAKGDVMTAVVGEAHLREGVKEEITLVEANAVAQPAAQPHPLALL